MIKQILLESFCLECQGCCRFAQAESAWLPSLLDEEISSLLKDPACAGMISENKKIKAQFCSKSNNFICPFLSLDKNKCKIYLFRPLECQLYPFLINYSQERVWLAVDTNCPFVEANLESAEFMKYVQYLSGLFTSAAFKKILKVNPQIIQSYPNVRNLMEIIL